MTDKEKEMMQIVSDYEDEKISAEIAIQEFNKLSNREIDKFVLDTYWNAESLEEFVTRYAIEDVEDWSEIDDARAIALIQEVKENLGNMAIEERNILALEKRYAKPEGTLFGIIHEEEVEDILAFLKKDDVIQL